jgi:excisionase family DNA binding protein
MEEIVVTVNEACRLLRIGRTKLYEVINSGGLVARKQGSRTVFLWNELKQSAESLPKMEVELEKKP